MLRLAVAMIMIAASALGADARAEERFAFVVANSTDLDIPDIAGVSDGAEVVAAALVEAGYDVRVERNLDREDLSHFMAAFSRRRAATDGVGVFYYAGHAAGIGEQNYLLGTDAGLATADDMLRGGVALAGFLDSPGTDGAGAIFIDARWAMPPADQGRLQPETLLVFSSVSRTTASDEVGAPTAFAEALASELARPGQDADTLMRQVADRMEVATGGRRTLRVAGALSVPLVVSTAETDEDDAGKPVIFVRPDGSHILIEEGADLDSLIEQAFGDSSRQPSAMPGGGFGVEWEEAARRAAEFERRAAEERRRAAEQAAREEQRLRDRVIAGLGDEELAPDGDSDISYPPFDGGDMDEPIPDVGPEGGGGEDAAWADDERDGTIVVARHPSLDAPDDVVAGEIVTISIALTQERITPEITVEAGPGASVNEEGALEVRLPETAEQWPIDIDLFAPGFDLADEGEWSRRVMLFKAGDSDFARFRLKARDLSNDTIQRRFMVRFYHAGQFLGSAARPVTVYRDRDALAAARAPTAPAATRMRSTADTASAATSPVGDIALVSGLEVPDLDVTIHYDDPDRLGAGLIVIHSPFLAGPVTEEFETPPGMTEWLNSKYHELVELGLRLRGAEPLAGSVAADPVSQRRFATKVAEGFGAELYRHFVPRSFKEVFWALERQGTLRSIQVTSNSPILPWEIVRPQADDGSTAGFLGIKYRMARWSPRAAGRQIDRPLSRLSFTGVATVAPPYDGNRTLPFQRVEVDALSKLAGFRLVDGDFASFEKLVHEVSTGFVHFSGHGEVNDPGTGSPVFAIRLLDQALDPSTWQALNFAPAEHGSPFYFFNACDTGRARSLGGFVQGWGPAVLASGASGFIGGMWPLADGPAADFSTLFYGGVSQRLKVGPAYVADVLREVRGKFLETGDPTYLAYTFYGNVNMQVVAY